MATFSTTLAPTPFGFFDSDPEFQQEADSAVLFVKRHLGDDILSVELGKKQIWSCLEQSLLDYGSMVNQHLAKSQLATYMGFQTGSAVSGSVTNAYPRNNLEFLNRQAEPYAGYAGFGGSYNYISGAIQLRQGVQDYDIYSELSSSTGLIFDEQPALKQTKLRIREIFHFSPQAAYRFFSSTSAINYLNNEFSFESFTPETIFYVLPVFEDILRAGQMDLSQRVRRSNYSYQLVGTKVRIYPMPTQDNPRKLFISLFYAPDPLDPAYTDVTLNGVSSIANVPYGNIQYSSLNAIGRQWVRQYCLALSKELLGLIRSKFGTVPIPGADLTLNGEALISQAREDKEKLRADLKELFDSLTYDKMLELEATKAENIRNTLKHIPIPLGAVIVTG
jgi:hypothetical protein